MAMTLPAEAYELSMWAKRLGADDPLPYLQDLALIDTDTIRNVGMYAWGGPDAVHEFWRHEQGGHSGARRALEAEAADLRQKLYSRLSPEWEGAQYDAFEQHMEELTDRMDLTASHFSTIGDVLVGIADQFEMRWYEVVGWVVTALGLVVAAVSFALALAELAGIVTAPAAGPTAIIGLIGLVVAIAAAAITYISTVIPRLEEIREALERLDEVAPPSERSAG